MPKTRSKRSKQSAQSSRLSVLESKVRLFKITTAVLALAAVALALYVSYPYLQLLINGQPAGHRLTGIDAPLSGAELSVINNAPNSYFEAAGRC